MSAVRALAYALILVALPKLTFAQRVTSDLLGTVLDLSGGILVGATVTVTHVDTGQTRTLTTDELGRYHAAGLMPGRYDVSAEYPGFAPTRLRDITLLVNQQAVVDVALQVGALDTSIDIVGRAPLIEQTTSHLSGVVTEKTLQELPLNGRDLFHLTFLQTGVLPTTTAGPNPFGEGAITRAAVQGARPTMNNLTLDGADINDPAYNLPPGGVAGVQMGVDGISEFRVLLSGYSAEFGRNAGAHVQLVTKSGTNDVRGSAFEFHRNDALDARNVFDVGEKPPFTRNQFGMSIGGPIRRSRTFFFGNFEGLHERKSITSSFSVPDLNARGGRLPSAADPARLVDVPVDPRMLPFLALFPAPNAEALGGGLATHRTSAEQPTRDDYLLLRVDHAIGVRDQTFARYVLDDSAATVPFMSTFVPGFPGERTVRNQYVMAHWQRMLSPVALNELKFNVTRQHTLARTANSYPLSISLAPDRALGSINVAGLPSIGNNLIYPLGNTSNTFELIDNVAIQRGVHMLKLGADVKRMQMDGPLDLFVNGEYLFSDLTAFGFPALSANPPLEFFLGATPFVYLGIDPAKADSFRQYRQNYVGAYLQDDWRITSSLTLNLGVRWEYTSNPTEAGDRRSNIRDVAHDAAPTVGPLWERVPAGLWSPRVGFAWTPAKGGKTVIRGGAGVARDQIWANLYFDTRFYEPFYRPLLYVLPRFEAPPRSVASIVGLGGPPSVSGSFGITYRPDFPYYQQYNASVQRELGPDLMLQVAYAGSRGVHLVRTGEANPVVPALGRRLNPNFSGSIPLIATDGESKYNSLQLGLQRRFARGVLFQGLYTLSKSVDDQSGPFPSDYVSESGVAQDFYNRLGDRGRSSFDRRHAFVGNFLYELPVGGAATGIRSALLSNWTVGGIVTLLSSPPFTANLGGFNNSGTLAAFPADRPDVIAGRDPCRATGTPDRWFDPSIFRLPAPGQFGNAGRNTLCGPNLATVDLLIARRVALRGPATLQFRGEIFNLLNRANYDVPVNTQGPNGSGGNGDAVFIGRRSGCDPARDAAGCGILAPNAGRIFRTVTTARQIQLGLRVTF